MADLPPLGSVKVDITANMAQLVRGLKTAQEKTRAATNIMGNDVEKLGSSAKYLGSAFDKYEINLEKVTRKTRKSTKEIGDEFKKSHSKIRVSASGITGGLEKMRMAIARIRNATLLFKFALAATFYAVTRFVKGAVSAYNQQELAERQLAQRIKSTGAAAGMTADELKSMASSLQKVTTYGDEAIIEMQGLLLTFTNIGRDVMPDAVEATLNMSTALGQDLKSSALMLGKALNDPILGITALSRAGIQFTVQQKEMIKKLIETGQTVKAQQMILQEFEKQMGGAARAARDTFGGSIQGLANALGDSMENIGRIIAKVTAPAVKQLAKEFETLNEVLAKPEVKQKETFIFEGQYDVIGMQRALQATKDKMKPIEAKMKRLYELYGAGAYVGRAGERMKKLRQELAPLAALLNEIENLMARARKSRFAPKEEKPETISPPDPKEWNEHLKRLEGFGVRRRAIMAKHQQELLDDEKEYEEESRRTWEAKEQMRIDALDTMRHEVKEVFSKMSYFAEQAARNIQDAFADFLFDPFEKGLQGMLESFINTLRRMAAEMLAAKILFSVFSGTPLGKFFPNPAPQGSSMAGGMLAPVGGAGDVTVMIDGVQVASHIRTLEQFNNRRGY